jgi:hypothetical protein
MKACVWGLVLAAAGCGGKTALRSDASAGGPQPPAEQVCAWDPATGAFDRDCHAAADTGAPAAAPAGRDGAVVTCAELADGPRQALLQFHWEIQREACPGSACVDFHDLDRACTLTFQHRDAKRTAVATAADCDRLTRMVAGTRALAVLAAPPVCPADRGHDESFTVSVIGGMTSAKTSQCAHPVLDALRRCVTEVYQRYFP